MKLLKAGWRRVSHPSFLVTSLAALAFFTLLAVLVTYPTATQLSDFSIWSSTTDALLESWTIEWNVHAFLSGAAGAGQIWDSNIFYPYPLSLAFTEHLLPTSFLLLPFALLGRTPLLNSNLGGILATILSGWGMYLLVTWITGNHRAGLVAGLGFAIAPFRLSHITQLHLFSTQWIPFILLSAACLIKYNKRVDLILLLIFVNLQFGSAINYAPLVAIALAIWMALWLFLYRRRIKVSLILRLVVFAALTFALNWPVLHIYQQVSDRMGLVRTLGDASVYGASIINYILPVGNSLLYGRLLNLPTHTDYLFPGIGVFVSTFPGVVVFLLAICGVLSIRSRVHPRLSAIAITALIIVIVGFVLSFGANEAAFGEGMSSLIAPLLPYPYLYRVFSLLQGLRVPLRFALLTTFGLAILAGIGFAAVDRRLWSQGKAWVLVLVVALVVVEHFPAPLPGVSLPHGGAVYDWLANVQEDTVVLEMPYYLHTKYSNQEVLRVYDSTIHWKRLVNGASGFKPVWLVKLGHALDGFPDWSSFDLLRHLGVDYLVLHHDQYAPQDWENLEGLLPGYLASIDSIHSVGDDLILQLRPPSCEQDPKRMSVDASQFPFLEISNHGSSTFVADPHYVSSVVTGSQYQEFLEPLFVLPGQTVEVMLPVDSQIMTDWRVDLANLDCSLTEAHPSFQTFHDSPSYGDDWRAVEVSFASGTVLQAVATKDSFQTCDSIVLKLRWIEPVEAGEAANLILVDRFGREVIGSESLLRPETGRIVSTHALPLAETVPSGQYQLHVRLLSAEGEEIEPVGQNGVVLTAPLSLPVTIRSQTIDQLSETTLGSEFGNGVELIGAEGVPSEMTAGDWVRFSLKWQSEVPSANDYTVFTQLIGPDGRVWGQQDNPHKGAWYPTSLWAPGEIVTDDYAIRLDPAAPAGEYHLIAGMYDPTSEERVGITEGIGQGSDFVDVAKAQCVVEGEAVLPTKDAPAR